MLCKLQGSHKFWGLCEQLSAPWRLTSQGSFTAGAPLSGSCHRDHIFRNQEEPSWGFMCIICNVLILMIMAICTMQFLSKMLCMFHSTGLQFQFGTSRIQEINFACHTLYFLKKKNKQDFSIILRFFFFHCFPSTLMCVLLMVFSRILIF